MAGLVELAFGAVIIILLFIRTALSVYNWWSMRRLRKKVRTIMEEE